MQKVHQNLTNLRRPGYRKMQTSSPSSLFASHGKGSGSDGYPRTIGEQLQLTDFENISDFESMSASATSDAVSPILTESTCSELATIPCHSESIRGEMLTRYIRQGESEEPVLVFARMICGQLQASETPQISQGSKSDEEIVLTQAPHLDTFMQPTGEFPGEMLWHYLHQGVKDEPVYVFANTNAEGEISSVKSISVVYLQSQVSTSSSDICSSVPEAVLLV